MTRPSAPPVLRRCGLETAVTNRQPHQTIALSPQTLAQIFGDEILRIVAQLAQRRKPGGSSS